MKFLKPISFWLIGIFILLTPAIYNGFPLVFSDTGTYIESGKELFIPVDRPIFYGLFITIFSLGVSLWFVVITQALLTFYFLWKLTQLVSEKITQLKFLVLLSFLVFTTGLGWYTSQLMSDFFTPIAIIGTVLLIFNKKLRKSDLVLISIITTFSILSHLSHLLIIGLILITTLISLLRSKKISFKQLILPFLVMFATIIISLLTNYNIDGKTKLSKGSHVFLIGKMLDCGVLQSYLDDKCTTKNYQLCSFKDSLPQHSRAMLWSGKSPVSQAGGWEATEKEYNSIINGILTSPKHLAMYVGSSCLASLSQLLQNDIGSGLKTDFYASPNSPPYQSISNHFSWEVNSYNQSRQNKNLWNQGLDFTFINGILNIRNNT